jgi:pimeloyl-ACP methyl ester carboxylesterase
VREETITLRSIKSYYVGGADFKLRGLPVLNRQIVPAADPRIVDMNGSYVVGQVYVQEYRLAKPRCPYPILLWHGGGMCGSQWEATPDGRDGWLWHFLRLGFDVLVSDATERGRSPWLKKGTCKDDLPIYRSQEEAWSVFRIGPPGSYAEDPSMRRSYDGQQFPTDAFDMFAKQFVPRWLGHLTMELKGYEALVQAVGPCVLLGHSQGGGYALQLAQKKPDLVRAVVAIEPTGMPDQAGGTNAPHLVLWGDYIARSELWCSYRRLAQEFIVTLEQNTQILQINLPDMGVRGNSHFMMLDRNSEDIAGLVGKWLQEHIQNQTN